MKQVLGRKREILLQSHIGGILSFSLYKVKLSLLQTYCTAWYGCQAGHLGTTFTDEMNVECREAVRRIAGLPRQTRSVLCPGLAWNENFHTQHERRVWNIFNTMLSSCNPAVSFIATKALHNTVGILARNRAFLSVKYQGGRLIRDLLVPLRYALGSGNDPRVEQIRELIRARIFGSRISPCWLTMCPHIDGCLMLRTPISAKYCWFGWWLGAWSTPSHHPTQLCDIYISGYKYTLISEWTRLFGLLRILDNLIAGAVCYFCTTISVFCEIYTLRMRVVAHAAILWVWCVFIPSSGVGLVVSVPIILCLDKNPILLKG